MICKFCKKTIFSKNNFRMGCCFECADIESIIINGESMFGIKCETKNEKILMIKSSYPNVNPYYWYSYHTSRLRKWKLNELNKIKNKTMKNT